MPALESDWFVGSITIPAQAFTVDASAATVAAGTYYLRHGTDSLSLLDAFDDAVVAAVGGTSVSTVKRDRRVTHVFNTARTVTWGAATQLRDLLGHTGNLGSASSHHAAGVSPLLWSPGFPGTTETIRGVDGYEEVHQAVYESDDGSESVSYTFGGETRQDIDWPLVLVERLRVATGTGGGTFHEFFSQCAQLGVRFCYHQDVVEDDTDTSTDVTWGTSRGPYVLRPEARSGRWYKRLIANADLYGSLQLPLHLVSEYA